MSSLDPSDSASFVMPSRVPPPASGARVGALLRRACYRFLAPARYDRLDGALKIARVEIERRPDPGATHVLAAAGTDLLPDEMGWKAAALALLDHADVALLHGKVDQGWKLLHAARRLEIAGFRESELPAFSTAMRAEAEKLQGWRQQALRELVGTVVKPKPPTVPALSEAALIRDEHFNNQGYKDQLLRTQILFLAAILAVVMAGLMGMAQAGTLPLGDTPPPADFAIVVAVVLFGNLGATISAMLRATEGASSARIPELTSANRLTFMRILMGGSSALVIYLVLQSELTGLFNDAVTGAVAVMTPQTVYVVAFVAGFTERLVLRAVEIVAGKAQPHSREVITERHVLRTEIATERMNSAQTDGDTLKAEKDDGSAAGEQHTAKKGTP